ncbi:MAG: GIY-YIG nuclease family protein [bacterium]|nr:GIY-YIG nuclease family protein [bacterium]
MFPLSKYNIPIKLLLKNFSAAPKNTGVYFFLSRAGKALYIGKAIDIRTRLRSHFANADTANPAKAKLLKETCAVRWELCDSEPEALIREAELIKKLKPRFNILLRDDKNYFFVAITKEPFPKVFLTHQPSTPLKSISYGQEAKYIGPFTDGGSLKQTLKHLRKIFPYCICKTPHRRPCLAALLGRCAGACCLKEARLKLKNYGEIKRRYRQGILSLAETLGGKRYALGARLLREMKISARKNEFEKAALLRDQLRALETVFRHRAVVANRDIKEEREKALSHLQKLLDLPKAPRRIEMYDMSNIQGTWAVGSMVVFTDGLPDKSQYRKFRIKTVRGIDDTAMMQEVIWRRLRHNEWPIADILAVDGGKGQMSATLTALYNTQYPIPNIQYMPILGLAKGKDELHYMTFEAKSYELKAISSMPRSRLPRPLRHLLNHLQAEAHRFAITYHRKLRSSGT